MSFLFKSGWDFFFKNFKKNRGVINGFVFLTMVFSTMVTTCVASATEVTGAGSTFVYPILSRWADAYKKKTGDTINYQSIGSGGGIKMIISKTLDFGATDKPLTSEELQKEGLLQFPLINGAVTPVVHLSSIKAGDL